MKIVITGGTGFIGRHLCHTLIQNQHELTVLSRNPSKARNYLPKPIFISEWNTLAQEALEKVLEGTEAVINLAGEPIADARWTEARKQLLRSSRIETTRRLVEALSRISKRPNLLINASGIGFYGPQELTTVNESSAAGKGFLADLCVDWEREACRAEDLGIRVVRLRIGMVLGKDGGALPKMVLPFRFFFGGPISPGSQQVSWIHLDDLARLINWLLVNPSITGPVNGVATEPVTIREFCRTLGRVLGRPSWLPVPAFALKIALGELSTLMTTGQKVEPLVAKRDGFQYTYPKLESALQSIFEKKHT